MAIRHWAISLGPYLAKYSSNNDRPTFEIIFPRLAMSLPATKHLVVAVSMLDELVGSSNQERLMSKSRRILYHYNQAIRHLTHHKASMIDIISASILAWVLEGCLFDRNRAAIHLKASSRLMNIFIADETKNNGSESSDIVVNHLTHTRSSCEGYASTRLSGANQYVQDETYIFAVLSARNSPQRMKSAKEARDALEEYFTKFEDPQGMDMSPMEANELLQSWELALLKYRHVATEPYAEVVSLHILVNLAQALLPVIADSPSESMSEPIAERLDHLTVTSAFSQNDQMTHPANTLNPAMEYCLRQTQESMAMVDIKAEESTGLRETTLLVLQKVVRHATNRSHQEKALQLLATL